MWRSTEVRSPTPGSESSLSERATPRFKSLHELAELAHVTLAARSPVQFVPQLRGGRDLHYWLHTLRLDLLPPSVLSRLIKGTPVLDTGVYRAALEAGDITQRPISRPTTMRASAGTAATQSRSTRCCSPPATARICRTWNASAPSIRQVSPCTNTASVLDAPRPGVPRRGVQRSFSSNTLRGIHSQCPVCRQEADHQRRRTHWRSKLSSRPGRGPRGRHRWRSGGMRRLASICAAPASRLARTSSSSMPRTAQVALGRRC